MEIETLEQFVTLAEHLHFRRTAESARISPSTLSRNITELEAEVGARLFERNRRQVALTPAGEAYLVKVADVLYSLDDAAREARRVAGGDAERLRIGHGDALAVTLLRAALPVLHARRPAVILEVIEAPSAELIDGLIRHRLDLALVWPPIHGPGLIDEPVGEDPLLAVVPLGHRLAKRSTVGVADLAGEPLVVSLRTACPGLHDRVVTAFRDVGAEPIICEQATTNASLLLLVAAGLGVTLVPASAAAHADIEGLVALPLDDPSVTIPLHLCWRRGEDNPATLAARTAIFEQASERTARAG